MKTLLLTSIPLLAMLLITPLAAEDTEPLDACDTAYDTCMDKCEDLEENTEKCYDLCDREHDRCIVRIKAQK